MTNLPKDPFILFSVLNTKLRDYYSSLDALCEDLGEDKQEILDLLEGAGFSYDSTSNQFS